ncbi:MAG: hypothetical protein JNK67_24225 [Alphaproteobacteria bacterium]|nr:hypothetical protein [Alphaproteobacteria bacterium]
MKSETELFEEFRQHAFVTSAVGIPYLPAKQALALLDACEANDLAVIGLDGFVANLRAPRLEPRNDVILDSSRIEAPGWVEFRDRANAAAREMLRRHATVPDLVFEFVLRSRSESQQKPEGGIEVDVGAADGRKARISNKTLEPLPRRGWTLEELVETSREPRRAQPTLDRSTRPR